MAGPKLKTGTKVSSVRSVMMARTRNGKRHASQRNSATSAYVSAFVIVASTFVSFVLVGSVVAACCCRCLKPKPGESRGESTPIQSHLLESGPPSDGAATSCPSSASSGSTGRQHNGSDVGTEDAVGTNSMYAPAGRAGYSTPGAHAKQYLAPPQALGPFFQPQYLSYGIPPEHTVLVTPAYLDGHATYGHQQPYSFPQAPMHTEPIYPGIAM
ncbi:hypothetical protein ANANG_G00059250 [Anguilla anguilla]|uniref:Uncharacterized protein n=1 Tax=Anguilla anguilla TaxID=7936 RepID=A0A9D3MNJ9_ANGAN|nr:hypothetical protein ANANG_G00059250 [Anguilla anguilla]